MSCAQIDGRRARRVLGGVFLQTLFAAVTLVWALGEHPAERNQASAGFHIQQRTEAPPGQSVALEVELATTMTGLGFIGHCATAGGGRFVAASGSGDAAASVTVPFHLRSELDVTLFVRCSRPSFVEQPLSVRDGQVAAIRVKVDDSPFVLVDVLALSSEWSWRKWHSTQAIRLAPGSHAVIMEIPAGVAVDQVLLSADSVLRPTGILQNTERAQWAGEKIFFSDRFMQSAADPTQWQIQGGTWRVADVTTSPSKSPTHSANAFSFACRLDETSDAGAVTSAAEPSGRPGLALTGHPQWRNYSIQAAVRPKGARRGGFGLVACWQDENNYILFRCPATNGPDAGSAFEMVRVRDGAEQVLASFAGSLQADRWYVLELVADGGRLSASVDRSEILHARDFSLLAGKAGLYSVAAGEVVFDDVLVRSVWWLDEVFGEPPAAQWDAVSGSWRRTQDGLLCVSRGRSIYLLSVTPQDEHVATVEFVPSRGAFGLIFALADQDNFAFAAFERDSGGRIIEVREGRVGELAATSVAPSKMRLSTLTLDRRADEVRIFLDGRLALRSSLPDGMASCAGLYGEGASGTLVRRFTLRKAQEANLREHASPTFSAEETMSNWANPLREWTPQRSGQVTALWHNKHFFGDIAISFSPQNSSVLRGIVLAAEDERITSGYFMSVQSAEDGSLVELRRRDERVAYKEISGAPARLAFSRQGSLLQVLLDDEPALMWEDAEPLRGSRVAVFCETVLTPQMVSIQGAQVDDFYFSDAPVDWRADCGQWEITNRWDCSPGWSWYGATTNEAAILWNRQSYLGDQSIDVFASFKMLTGKSIYYRTGDINLTFCADGRTLESGYTLLYGGWGGGRTALLRRGQVVAQTADPAFVPPQIQDGMPGTEQLHRRWFWINLTRRGNRITASIDGVKALEFIDPEPLNGSRFAVWTVNNWIMLARARVAYSSKGPREPEYLASDPAIAVAPSKDAPFLASASSETHPCVFYDFERTTKPWKGGSSDGIILSRVRRRSSGHALRIHTLRPGLVEAAVLETGALDLAALRKLSLDYRATPYAKLHLYLEVAGQMFAVQFVGPIDRDGPVPVVGSMSDVRVDGQWHRASIHLADALEAILPPGTPMVLQRLSIGHIAPPTLHYDTVGLDGYNPPGTMLELDNVIFHSASSADPAVVVRLAAGEPAATKASVTRRDYDEPTGNASSSVEYSFAGLSDGLWFIHAAAQSSDGQWSEPVHYPVEIDRRPPAIAKVTPPPGQRTAATRLVLQIAEDGAGIDLETFRAIVNGEAVLHDSAAVSWEAKSGTISIDLERLATRLADGALLTLAIENLADRAGNSLSGRPEYRWRFDRSLDRKGPSIFSVTSSQVPPLGDTFEDDNWRSRWKADPGKGALLMRTSGAAASGRSALMAVCDQYESRFLFGTQWPQFDAQDYPLLAFDYRAGPGLRTDLFIEPANVAIRFLDQDNPSRKVGVFVGVEADGAWRSMMFNLKQALQSVYGGGAMPVSRVFFADSQRLGNALGETLYLDNFRVIPRAKSFPLEWQWEASDVSGVASHAWAVSRIEDSPRWLTCDEPRASVESLPPGRYHFRVKCIDSVGNASISEPIEFVVE